MELVYLWVEEYKNIKNQGFNFSPRFECKYDKDSNELTIDENEDYISIFPENINITAIVGENGSGKSNLLNFIKEISDYKKLNYNYILLFKYSSLNKKLFFINKSAAQNTLFEELGILNIQKYSKQFPKLSISLINSFQLNKTSFNEEYSKLILNDNLTSTFEKKKPFDRCNLMFKENERFDFSINTSTVNYDIHSIYTQYTDEIIYKGIYCFDLLLSRIINKFGSHETFLSKIQKKIEEISCNKSFNFYKKLEYIKKHISEIKKDTRRITLASNEEKLFSIFFNFDFESVFKELNLLTESFPIQNFHLLTHKFDESDLLSFLKSINIISYNFYDSKNNLNLEDMSSGEQQLLKIFPIISNDHKFNIHKYTIILLDEPDMFLHPNWQKKLLNELLSLSKKYLNEKNIQFIITSHSPFLLSDLSKENTIFLEKDIKTSTCINVTKNTDINPFGANIHTLLSHGFFMQDGLMGEFAKGKIEEIKKFYELVKKWEKRIKENKIPFIYIKIVYLLKIKKFRHIQSIIGEPFLQTVIKNYLDELEIIFNGKKQFLQDEIKRLQELESSL